MSVTTTEVRDERDETEKDAGGNGAVDSSGRGEKNRDQILAFGIPSLDELFGYPAHWSGNPEDFGIGLRSRHESTSLCIIGPDGTGKSVLALHLAAQYVITAGGADVSGSGSGWNDVRVFYVSTDLSYAKAQTIWESFVLGDPTARQTRLKEILPQGRARARKPPESVKLRIQLDRYTPLVRRGEAHSAEQEKAPRSGGEPPLPLTEYLYDEPSHPCSSGLAACPHRRNGCPDDCKANGSCREATDGVCHRLAFIDMESATAGDDWGLINRLMATMEAPAQDKPRNLLIIDAVEGLETLGGERDAFGQDRNRRSRIAQILRAAKGKCHVVFIVEEPKDKERLPEEFVSDVVLRLRVESRRDYAQRSVEIEKLRGQAYVRGRHDCRIRRGSSTQTGDQENPDARAFRIGGEETDRSYFQVIHSLQYLSREVMEIRLPHSGDTGARLDDPRTWIVLDQPKGLCGFGIHYLDDMIGSQVQEKEKPAVPEPFGDPEGLPWGQITALIGDEGTHKSRLGRAFLAQAFPGLIRGETGISGEPENNGVALLLTVQPMDSEQLAQRFFNHHNLDIQGIEEKSKELLDAFGNLMAGFEGKSADLSAFGWVPEAIETFEASRSALKNAASMLPDETASMLPDELVAHVQRIKRAYAPHCQLGEIVDGLRESSAKIPKLGAFEPKHRLNKKRLFETARARLEEVATKVDDAVAPLMQLPALYKMFKRWHVAAEEMIPVSPNGAQREHPGQGEDAEPPAAAALRGVILPPDEAGDAARRLMEYFGSVFKNIENQVKEAEQLRRFNDVMDRTVCRRLEIHHMTAANLFHIVHSLVQEGMHILYGGHLPDTGLTKITDTKKAPGRIRLVIDDWSGITNLYPEVRDDPLFLPFLTFYLKRQGITTLIIDTQPGRLNHILSHETDRELRALVPFHLYSWHVTFYGEKRVALAPLPPISDGKRVVVRELRPYNGQPEQLIVDPHFEFYSGFDDDRTSPRAIPLQVQLYHEDESNDSYHDDVSAVFHRLFGPYSPEGSAVIRIDGAESYEILRDFAYLQGSAALEHTLVLQIDEYWSQEGGSLSDLRPYLNATVSEAEGQPSPIEDPFRLYRRTEIERTRQASVWKFRGPEWQRFEKFRTFGYSLVPDESSTVKETPASGDPETETFEPLVDRVPYTVDFGILLANRGLWLPAIETKELKVGKRGAERGIKEVWEELRVGSLSAPRTVISWRQFFDACLKVADLCRSMAAGIGPGGVLPFDVDLLTTETISSLLLEIWASELYALGGEAAELFPARRDVKAGDGLLELTHPDALQGRSRRALFAAWLLLEEVLSPAQFGGDGFQFKRRQGHIHAVACRHWYSTASLLAAKHPNIQLVPMRLPGHYSTRGDWFLGVAAGSRSNRLGERAIDLLTSRRANIIRMQHGLGLPVRGWGGEKDETDWIDAEFRSPFPNYDSGAPRHFRLHDIWSLGGGPAPGDGRPEEFFNLWRSRLRAYDQHSRIFAKWIKYVHEEEAAAWPPAPRFERYDAFAADPNGMRSATPDDYKKFELRCNELHQALSRSTPAPVDDHRVRVK
jgi:KaiC/GvpD/RAD55 family RecA-like ATPase